MYCPKCKQEVAGKFCPNCGTALIEKPQDDIRMNIGDNSAIMGGINVNRSETHNSTSYDQRTINSNHVTNNIVERTKTDAELRNERNILFMECCKQVFSDGLLTEEDKRILVTERIRLGLDETEAAHLIEMARKSSGCRSTTLSMRDEMTLKTIDRYIEGNSVAVLNSQTSRLAALARNYRVDSVLYRYYMLLAALKPEELIDEYESSTADEYWQTYWAAIAYLKRDDINKSEDAIVKLDLYPEYSEDNSLLLSAVSTYKELGAEAASDYICAILPEHCSALLLPFIHALFLEVDPERAKEVGADKRKCQFYIDNLVAIQSPEAKAAKRKAAEKEAKRKAAEEEAKRKAAEEEAKRKAAEEEAKRKAAEEESRRLNEMISCPNCGETISASSKFCEFCGKRTVLICSACNAELNAGARFCEFCGTKVEEKKLIINCPACGERLKAGARFCEFCGTRIAEAQEAPESIVAPQTDSKEKSGGIEELCKIVEGGDYIDTLHLNRSWILPLFIDLSFEHGRFSRDKFFSTKPNYDKSWRNLLRNLKALSEMSDKESIAYKIRSGWWNKEVALAMANLDYEKLGYIVDNCKIHDHSRAGEFIIIPRMRNANTEYRENYFYVNPPKKAPLSGWNCYNSKDRNLISLFSSMQSLILNIENANDDIELYEAVKDYNDIRAMRDSHFAEDKAKGYGCTPQEYNNSFIGDGVYWSMMTMVKYLGLYFVGDNGKRLTRDECIAEIANKVFESGFDGIKLLDFCEEKFFRGLFNWKDYKSKR